jgi:hypothetical protein
LLTRARKVCLTVFKAQLWPELFGSFWIIPKCVRKGDDGLSFQNSIVLSHFKLPKPASSSSSLHRVHGRLSDPSPPLPFWTGIPINAFASIIERERRE